MAHQTSDEIRAKLQVEAPLLKETYHIAELGIFGSYVRGTQKQSSDVDILVSFIHGHKDFFNYFRCKHFLEDLLIQRWTW
jgi:predicted nucleotidyltransferase